MKRHPSLHPLSHHHHHALVRALEIRRAGELPATEREAAFRRQAGIFLEHWNQAGRLHFREEEEILLPAYARHANLEENPDVVRMMADHAHIRAQIYELEQALAGGKRVEELLASLGRRLHDHVRLEEERVFPAVEAALSEEELKEIGNRFTPFHAPCELPEKR